MHQWLRVKAGQGQPALHAFRIGAAKSDQMQADITLHLGFRPSAKRRRRIRDRDHLNIALGQHDAAICRARPDRLGLLVDAVAVLRIGRLHKAEPVKLAMRLRHIRHEMRYMIEEDLLSDRQLPRLFHIPFFPGLLSESAASLCK